MYTLISSLFPVFLLIILGNIFQRKGFPGKDFWPISERLTYYVLFPALLVHSLAHASWGELPIVNTMLSMMFAMLAVGCGLLLLRFFFFPIDGPSFSSIVQGSIRTNSFIGMSIALALFQDQGVTLSSIAILAIVPLANVMSVSVVSSFSAKSGFKPILILQELYKNPLILACILGFLLNISGLTLPIFDDLLSIFGRAALPLGLMAVGAGLKLEYFGDISSIALSCTAKLLLLPAITYAFLTFFSITGPAAAVAIIFTAVPSSASAYILAKQLGGNHTLMASIVTIETMLALVTLPIVFILFLGL